MALYFVHAGEGSILVRAINGHRALEITGGASVVRILEGGPEGAIGPDGNVQDIVVADDPEEVETENAED